LGASYLFYLNREFGVSRDPQVVLSAPAYAREFTQYNQAIEKKQEELIRLTTDNPELYKEFSTDLDRLEKSYVNLRTELPQTPNQEALIQAMIQNLQWQIDLLNQQLTILQRIKQSNQPDETTIFI
jgi:predicted  nucleic acid-binding Zn-ribbon protein